MLDFFGNQRSDQTLPEQTEGSESLFQIGQYFLKYMVVF